MQEKETEVNDEEVIDTEAQETAQEVSEAEESAAFSASLNGEARAEEAPAEQDDTEEQAEEEAGDSESDEVIEQEAAEEGINKQVGVTPEQLTEMLAKLPALEDMTSSEIRKVYGKIGEINQAVQKLQGAGAKSGGVKITADRLKRISEEFGEEFAQNLADDLNDVLGGAEVASNSQQNNVDFEARVADVRQELSRDMQRQLLRMKHKDAFDIAKTDEFKVWLQTQSEEDQFKLNNSWEAIYFDDKLTEFKSWKESKNSGAQQRKENLQRAITPKKVQAAAKPQAMTEEDGFYAALGKR